MVVCAIDKGNTFVGVLLADMNDVTGCSPTQTNATTSITFTVTAMALTTATTGDRRCTWNWSTGAARVPGTFSIQSSNGLPVELMDFTIESNDRSRPRAAEEPSVVTDDENSSD